MLYKLFIYCLNYLLIGLVIIGACVEYQAGTLH